MGFVLWTEDGVAWAQGTHEYKPMGTAAIAASDLFRPRDFSPARKPPRLRHRSYVGFFASIIDLNHWLTRHRQRPA